MSILSYFPDGSVPRTTQSKTLLSIDKAFASGKKFVILYAPTGSGKSFIAKTLGNSSKPLPEFLLRDVESGDAFSCRYSNVDTVPEYYSDYMKATKGGCTVLTITKNLQDQYKSLFNASKLFKGKSNYTCMVDTTLKADMAPCNSSESLRKRCEFNKLCPYYNARNNSLINSFSVLNYKMYSTLPKHLRNREFIVCDEASELPNELISIYTRKIPLKILKEVGINGSSVPLENRSKLLGWLNDVTTELNTKITSIERRYKKKSMPDNISKQLMGYRNLSSELEITISMWDYTEYVVDVDMVSVIITPLKCNKLSKIIFDHADKVLLMSGTIIDHTRFAKHLGIDDYEYIEVDSEFDPKKAPIFTVNSKRSLNRSNLRNYLPTISDEIQKICERHRKDKGIIHTHTNDITKFLHSSLRGDRFLYRLEENENNYILDQHTNTDYPTVLVSPSLSYGIDLKGDLAKFQIIVKAAFLPLNNTRVKKLFEEDPQWYVNEMLNTLVQACGRGVRCEEDECVTYILDGNITTNVIRNRSILPKYFVERFI